MSALHPVDVARLGDIARLQRAWRENGFLIEDDRRDLIGLVRILLLRHGSNAARAEAVADRLLAHAIAADNIASPTIAALIKMAAQGTQTHETARAVGGQRR